MDLDCILHNPAIENSNVHFVKEDTYDFHLENTLDMKVLMKKFKLSSKNAQSVTLDVSNTDRAFGAIFGSEITRKYGNSLPDDVYTAHCVGAGGQSFGAFIPNGLTLDLVGDCNDYMGKGLSGGKIVVRPPKGITFKPEENIITATWPCTVLPAARPSSPAWPVSASPCATAVPPPLWRALATTAAST